MMSDLIEVRVSNLVGAPLDWAVAKTLGWQMVRVPYDIDGNYGGEVLAPPDFSKDFQFPPRGTFPIGYFLRRWSTDWSHGGPLFDNHLGGAHHNQYLKDASSRYSAGPSDSGIWLYGPTALIAFCRTLVLSKVGDTVLVPKELIVDSQ